MSVKPARDAMPIILLGARLKELRKQAHLTQQAVADRLRVDRTTYTKYENGRVCPDQQGLVALAELFGVSVDYLLGRDDEQTAPAVADAGDAPLVLSPQEKLLVQMFRQLTPEQRDELSENARARFVSERYGRL